MPQDLTAPAKSFSTTALQGLGILAAGIALTSLFIYLGFPYERLAQQLSQQLQGSQNVQLRYSEIGPRVHWLGPGVAIADLAVVSEGTTNLTLDEVSLRPAWSLSWFRGVPSIYVTGSAGAARAGFEITLGDPLSVRGEVRDLDLQRLPVPGALAKASLQGTGEFAVDATRPADGNWQGTARFTVQDGSFAPPDLKLALPYTSLQSTLTLTPDGFLELAETRLEGPVLSGTAAGRIGMSPESPPDPLDVDLEFKVIDPEIQKALRENKISVSIDGSGKIHFGGTLAKPRIR